MTAQVACLSLCHVGHLWSCCVTPSHPGGLHRSVDAFVLLGCVTRCLWAATGKTRASMGPTALDPGMGAAAALTLVGVMTSMSKQGNLS